MGFHGLYSWNAISHPHKGTYRKMMTHTTKVITIRIRYFWRAIVFRQFLLLGTRGIKEWPSATGSTLTKPHPYSAV